MSRFFTALFALFLFVLPLPAAPTLEVQFALPRRAYQTNEDIALVILRKDTARLPATELTLSLSSAEGSTLRFSFPLPAVAVQGGAARSTEHLHLNGRLLRPGKYSLQATAHDTTSATSFEVYTHQRQSSFRLVDWSSRAKGEEQALLGEEGMGFNVLYAAYGGLSPDDTIRAGLDYMWCCTMGGGHQMDLRMECDWSDPWVLGGATARVVRRAFVDRVNPHCLGVHFYDEPGLTWHKHPRTGEFTPHNLPSQNQAYRSAFGRDPLEYFEAKPGNPEHAARWQHWGRWKMAFLESAWKEAAFGVHQVRPDFLSANQSVYGWSAFADGYYFNIARPLSLLNGHGGYDDYGGAYYNPSFTFEFGRMRDLQRPNWYLPTWYANMPPNRFRLEQYLSFMGNLQGMMKPPDMLAHHPLQTQGTAEGIVESNRLMGRLGTIFTTMPVTRPEVAVLYSLSHNLETQFRDMKDNYEGSGHARQKIFLAYLAGKLIHNPLFPVVEEDVLDGTLAAHHRAVVLPGINYLEPKVIQALQDYIADGGVVLLSDDCQVKIKGAIKIGAGLSKEEQVFKDNRGGEYVAAARKFAIPLKNRLRERKIGPLLDCSEEEVLVSRQASGVIEYLFTVNACYDSNLAGHHSLRPTTATVKLLADGRPVYDAIRGTPENAFKPEGDALVATFRYGPGQMRVFARTRQPIGKVLTTTPEVRRDYTDENDPLSVEIGAVLQDAKGRILAGSAPLSIQVLDPAGNVRHALLRATRLGQFQMRLPLACNDPPGQWTVRVKELLSGTSDETTFTLPPLARCGAMAGVVPRAVRFGNEDENLYRFFKQTRDVTILIGTAPYHQASAERLARILKPWGVRAKIARSTDIRPRPITEEEAKTWCGLEPGKVKPGRINDPAQVGYDLPSATILLGCPEDNPLIAFLQRARFLPYKPVRDVFPGRDRGYLAWQRDGLAYGEESITLIAHDEAGLAEAVGSLYEVATGLRPLTRLTYPVSSAITPAKPAAPSKPTVTVAWHFTLADRPAGFLRLGEKTAVIGQDGTLVLLDPSGKTLWKKMVSGGEKWLIDGSSRGDLLVLGASHHVVGFDALGKQLFDLPLKQGQHPLSAVCIAVAPDGQAFAVGDSSGGMAVYDRRATRLWAQPGVDLTDPKARPIPFVSTLFSGDGKSLLALKQQGAGELWQANNGKQLSTLGGATVLVPPRRIENALLYTDPRNAVVQIDSTGKTIHRAGPAQAAIVELSADGKQALAFVASTRAVQTFPLDQQKPGWSYRPTDRVVKLIRPGKKVALALWGGWLEILDGEGKVRVQERFHEEIAALDWVGELLLVGLSDGTLQALKLGQ